MRHTPIRIPLIVLSAFLAVTAIAGGIGLLAGFNAPPVEMLQGSVFKSFVVPGLALAIIVGGLAACTVILLAVWQWIGELACVVSGAAIIIFEIVEIATIGFPPGASTIMQVFYLSLGLVLVVLGLVGFSVARRRLDGPAPRG